MTYGELAEFVPLKREIELHMERLAALKASIENDIPIPNASYISREHAAEVKDVMNSFKAIIRRRVEQQKEILAYINAIPDEFTRQIFTLRFCQGLDLPAIADILGGGYKQASIKQRIFRYIKQN